MERKFNSIDLFKFLMAIVVVTFHTNPFDKCTNVFVNEAVIIIADISVPFFFIASGYLLAAGWGDTPDARKARIKKTLVSTLKLYTVWTVLSLPLTLYGYVMSGNSVFSCILSYAKYFLFVGKLYNSYHLWYLLSMIYALGAIWFLVSKNRGTRDIMALGVAWYAVCPVFAFARQNEGVSGLAASISGIFYYIFNEGIIFRGLLFVGAGICIRGHGRTKTWTCVAGLTGAVALRYALLNYAVLNELYVVAGAVSLFLLVLNMRLKDNRCYSYLREMSKYIYLLHLLCFSFYTFIVIRQPNKLGVDSFFVTLSLSSAIAAAIIFLKRFKAGKL